MYRMNSRSKWNDPSCLRKILWPTQTWPRSFPTAGRKCTYILLHHPQLDVPLESCSSLVELDAHLYVVNISIDEKRIEWPSTSQCACLQLCMKQLSHLHGRALWFPTYLSSTWKRDWDWSLHHSRLPECNILIRLLEKTTRKPQLTVKKHYHRAARGHGFPWSNTILLRSLSRRSGRGELCTYMEN